MFSDFRAVIHMPSCILCGSSQQPLRPSGSDTPPCLVRLLVNVRTVNAAVQSEHTQASNPPASVAPVILEGLNNERI